mmetsp:Transcript_86074/g.244207  ORF Transcript_86074/g.244207 Transcript_86074/m.244207 type:complete len:213 (-) Transcript_86074:231-869(-)
MVGPAFECVGQVLGLARERDDAPGVRAGGPQVERHADGGLEVRLRLDTVGEAGSQELTRFAGASGHGPSYPARARRGQVRWCAGRAHGQWQPSAVAKAHDALGLDRADLRVHAGQEQVALHVRRRRAARVRQRSGGDGDDPNVPGHTAALWVRAPDNPAGQCAEYHSVGHDWGPGCDCRARGRCSRLGSPHYFDSHPLLYLRRTATDHPHDG